MVGPLSEDDLFARLFSDELPGKRERAITPNERVLEDWDAKPLVKVLYGKEVELFTIGQLAQALGLRPVTLRKWETMGWIPMPPMRTKPPNWAGLPSKTVKGRRLWTRPMVAGIVRIAEEEGLLERPRKRVEHTNFTPRVVALYEQVMRELKEP